MATGTPAGGSSGDGDGRPSRGPSRLLRNTAIFSIATGLSRIAGLLREVVAAAYFGTTVQASAFTIAFQVPNLVRALVADAALSAAFVPVFTELLEQGRRKEAVRLAGALFGLILAVLGVITVVFFVAAPVLMPVLTGGTFDAADDALTAGLSQMMFPIVVILGLNGLVVGILNAHDHFSVPAISPLVWNVVIIVALVALRGLFDGRDEIYAYAIGILVGTVVQFAMVLPVLRRVGFRLTLSLDWRDPRIARVLRLMLPVTIGLGVINISLVINSVLGTLVSEGATRAIDAAFRIYMLPQGIFSVAIATVLFPHLSRLAARRDLPGLRRWSGDGMRLIFLVLMPCAAATAALAEPVTRLVFERGTFGPEATRQTAEALLFFGLSLPFSGANLILTRTFFSLQRPWTPTRLAAVSLVVNTAVSLALYRPFGIGGIVAGTVVANLVMTVQQAHHLRRELDGFDVVRTLKGFAVMLAASVAFGVVAYATHWFLDAALGRSLVAQAVSVGAGLLAGTAVYAGIVLLAGIPEASYVAGLVRRRLA